MKQLTTADYWISRISTLPSMNRAKEKAGSILPALYL